MIKDHLKLYRSLDKNKVRYLIIGGIACAIYGSPRVTVDLDIFVEPTLDNSKALFKALKEAGFGTVELTTPKKIMSNELNIFNDYIKMDVLTKVKGIDFEKCWKARKVKEIDGIKINLISIENLIKSKKAANRDVDKYDIKILKRVGR